MKKVNLYIHFGAEKTGSSYIQQFIDLNRKALIKNGLLYLTENLTWNGRESINHQSFFKNLQKLTTKQQSELAKEKISSWVVFSENRKVNNFLISWESAPVSSPFFEALTKSPFVEIFPIIYLRNQVDWIKSGWKQYGCKIEGVNHISDWVKYALTNPFWHNLIDWHYRIEEIEKLFGKRNLIVKSYDIEKKYLLDSFLNIFNITVQKLNNIEIKADYINKPLRNDLIELIIKSRCLLSEPFSEELTELFYTYLGNNAFIKNSKIAYNLTANESKEIESHFLNSNNKVAEKYFKLHVNDVFHFSNTTLISNPKANYTLTQFVETYVELLYKRNNKLDSIEKEILNHLQKINDINPPTLQQ